ncbi:MAG TPA: regulatory protein RecX [Ideonella sp.]|uniref:regulatory protein RecX n=1 Tax=Ideonella sp. TaxID=1929293 RepID=UPI002C8BA43E|nr:regulatory protein RecX [Ideonella sp.]HSI48177.1 regulatory protein RecX [Ideonella sp.]
MKTAPPSLKAQALALLARREHSRAELRTKLLAHGRKRLAWLAEDQRRAAKLDFATAFGLDTATSSSATEPDDGQAELARETLATEVDEVLDWLEAQRYQSDARFIESRVNARAGRMGQLRIKLELAQHGLTLDAETAQQLRQTELLRARELWRRRFGEAPAPDTATRAKQMRFLAARGFSGEVVRRVVGGREDD